MSNHPGTVFSAGEISKATQSSEGATNQVLRLLLKLGIVARDKKGNLFLYKVNDGDLLTRHFKIFENLLSLNKFKLATVTAQNVF